MGLHHATAQTIYPETCRIATIRIGSAARISTSQEASLLSPVRCAISRAALLAAALLVLVPASALATGGKSIATAPVVAYGQQEFGNTATDGQGQTPKGCINGVSWWSLPVLAGDHVTVDFEGAVDFLDIWPLGTTDFNVNSGNPFREFQLSSNGKQEGVFTVPAAGTMPLEFFTGVCYIDARGEPGPYDFLATDLHSLVVGLKPYVHIKRTTVLSGTADLADGTPVHDGLVFHLAAKWRTGSTVYRAISNAGTLNFQLALPPEVAGQAVRLVITRGADTSYQAVKSSPLNVKVAGAHHHRHRHRH